MLTPSIFAIVGLPLFQAILRRVQDGAAAGPYVVESEAIQGEESMPTGPVVTSGNEPLANTADEIVDWRHTSA
jgi:hypothetical protein